jgi:hypothetical protein
MTFFGLIASAKKKSFDSVACSFAERTDRERKHQHQKKGKKENNCSYRLVDKDKGRPGKHFEMRTGS